MSTSAFDCPINPGLSCSPSTRNCKTCGWTRDNNFKRRKALRRPKPVATEPKPHKTSIIVCVDCGTEFEAKTTVAKRCKDCQKKHRYQMQKEAYQRRKEAANLDEGTTQTVWRD